MKKLLVTAFIVTLALLCAFSASAATYSGECGENGNNVTWALDTDSGVLTISGSGRMKDFDNSYYYSSIPWEKFDTKIKTVTINSGVTSIGDYAFYSCDYLTKVTIPSGVTSIGKRAFCYCRSLTSINIPDSVVNIGTYAFNDCDKLPGNLSYLQNTSALKNGLTKLFAPDGRSTFFSNDQKDAQLKVGWYTAPVTIMYAADGRTRVTLKSEIEAYKNVGWYTAPVTIMYAADGRTRVTLKSEVEAYKKVGWYANKSDVYTTMYALDGRTLDVLNTKISAYQNVGWYLYDDYICAKAQGMIATAGYDAAVDFLDACIDVIDNYKGYQNDPWYIKWVNKRTAIFTQWLAAEKAPIAILGYYMSENSIGTPEVNFRVRNLTNKEISAFGLTFTCYDAYGKVTTDYPSLYNGTISGDVSSTSLDPGEEATYTWTLYSNEKTAKVGKYYIKKVAYADGKTWYK